jgi:hypothetical protein
LAADLHYDLDPSALDGELPKKPAVSNGTHGTKKKKAKRSKKKARCAVIKEVSDEDSQPQPSRKITEAVALPRLEMLSDYTETIVSQEYSVAHVGKSSQRNLPDVRSESPPEPQMILVKPQSQILSEALNSATTQEETARTFTSYSRAPLSETEHIAIKEFTIADEEQVEEGDLQEKMQLARMFHTTRMVQ